MLTFLYIYSIYIFAVKNDFTVSYQIKEREDEIYKRRIHKTTEKKEKHYDCPFNHFNHNGVLPGYEI